MKKAYFKIVLAVVLLLTVFSAMGSIVQAASTDTYTVSIEYNPHACTVTVTVDGVPVGPNQINGNVYLIPKNHGVFQINVAPKAGYRLSNLMDKDTHQVFPPTEKNVFQPSLTRDVNYKIQESAEVYTIEERSSAEVHHDTTFGSIEYTYSPTNPGFVELPVPTTDGYVCTEWQFFDGNVLSYRLPVEGKDKVEFPTNFCLPTNTVIIAKPVWEGLPQTVTRYDYEFRDDNEDGKHDGTTIPVNEGNGVVNTTSWTELNGTTNVNGKDGGNAADGMAAGGYKKYPGYYDFAEYCTEEYYTTLLKVRSNHDENKMYRYYVPIKYALSYENTFVDTSGYPQEHKYNVDTPIKDYPNPERTGYNFAGWKVYITKNGVKTDVTASLSGGNAVVPQLTLRARELCLAEGNDDNKIILEAQWTPKTYTVSYDWNGADESKLTFTKLSKYVYDTDLVITDPIRTGYTFLGWELTSGETVTTIDSVDGKTTLVACTYTDDITLKALWKANEYTVTFDENLAEQKGTESMTVTFDTLPDLSNLLLPQKEGHKLLGFTLTKDGDDFIITCGDDGNVAFLRDVWDIPSDTTLYAKWDVLSYDLTVNYEHAQVWINGVLYTGTVQIPYGTTVTVKVAAEDGYKVTAWNDAAIAHTKEYIAASFGMPAENVVHDVRMLPMVTVPTLTVDYVGERFLIENTPDGLYQIQGTDTALQIRIAGGELFVNDVKVTQIAIPNVFFGDTLSYTVFGDGITAADSDPVSLALAKRPEKPVYNDHFKGAVGGNDSVVINRNLDAGYTYEYEFALSLTNDGTSMLEKFNWMTPDGVNIVMDATGRVTFKGLNPGTIYYIFVRVKAVEGQAPHGEQQWFEVRTNPNDIYNQILAELENMKTGGLMVDQLIEDAKNEIKGLEKPSATFYETLMSIYNRVTTDISFAQAQDDRINELLALLNALKETSEFSSVSEEKLDAICNAAIEQIQAATEQDAIQSTFNAAVAELKTVKLTYLFYENMQLTSFAGLLQGTKLFWAEIVDTDALINAVSSAIQAGRVSVATGNNLTLAEAADLLRELEVMGCYNLKLTNGTSVISNFEGMYEMRWLIPESLRDVTGLQVACYNEKTGVLEILSTTRDGNYLVFKADHVNDFVVLGDPTVVLTGFIAALGAILLCQLIAIVMLIVRRSKNKNVRSYGLMLPVLLTVRFLPENGLTVVVVLGALVILAQIVLLYLLLSSDVFLPRKRRKSAPAPQETEDVTETEPEAVAIAVATEEETVEDEAQTEETIYAEELAAAQAIFAEEAETEVEEDSIEALSFEETEELADEASYEEELAEEELVEDVEEEALVEDTEDSYDYFIEPAANPRYSLPEEDFAEIDPEVEEIEETVEEEELESSDDAAVAWEYDESEEPEEAVAEDEWQDEAIPADDNATEWTEEPIQNASEWTYDGEEALATEEEPEATEAETVESVEDLTEELAEESVEESAEETEEDAPAEPQDEFYIEPDAEGDRAPAPDYSIYTDEDDTKKYDGYEE